MANPRYLDYNSLIERVRSFENVDWPEHNPSPVAMAEAGFFYNSKYNSCLIFIKLYLFYIKLYRIFISLSLSLSIVTGWDNITTCFNCGGQLEEWVPSDEPWQEHAFCFPFCAFVRYVKGTDFIRD